MTPSTRIIANTVATYARLGVIGVAGLLVTPAALRLLGVIDFGIFSVIAGCLSFLMFINTALSAGAQRHIAYSLGEGDHVESERWVTTSALVHAGISAVVAFLAFGASHWVLTSLLHLPPERLGAAAWIYRFVVATVLCNLLSTPYNALLMAHEEIVLISMINVGAIALLIAGVFCLPHVHGDLLVWYAGIYSTSQVVMFAGPAVCCFFLYPASRRFAFDHGLRNRTRELLSFSGWNLYGALAGLVRIQGPAILLNMFVGPVANAAYGLALQVNAFAANVSGGVLRATTPPIVKRYSAGNHAGVRSLSLLSNAFAFGLLWLLIGPVLIDTRFCLRLWVHAVPPHTEAFVSLLLLALLIDQLTSGFLAPLQATGRIALYQIVVGTFNCIAVPCGFLLLRAGMSASAVLWAGAVSSAMAGCARLWFAKERVSIPVSDWLRFVVLPAGTCAAASSAFMFAAIVRLHEGTVRLAALFAINCLITCPLLWFFAMTAEQRERLGRSAFRRILFSRRRGAGRPSPVLGSVD